MKRLFVIILLAVAAFWYYGKCVDGFYESSIHLKTWPKERYGQLQCLFSPEEVQKVLSQPFTYLGKGRQFFVFASQDGKYVLKFVKCQRIKGPNRQERVDAIFASCALAATELRDNTGVVFVHLNSDSEVKSDVLLIDKIGMKHTIAIDEVPFVLQRRAIPVKEVAMTEERLAQLIDLIKRDAAHHVYDKDSGLIERNNVGFLDHRAIHIDIGTLERSEVDHSEEQIAIIKKILTK